MRTVGGVEAAKPGAQGTVSVSPNSSASASSTGSSVTALPAVWGSGVRVHTVQPMQFRTGHRSGRNIGAPSPLCLSSSRCRGSKVLSTVKSPRCLPFGESGSRVRTVDFADLFSWHDCYPLLQYRVFLHSGVWVRVHTVRPMHFRTGHKSGRNIVKEDVSVLYRGTSLIRTPSPS